VRGSIGADSAPPAATHQHVVAWALSGALAVGIGIWLGAPWPPVRVGPGWVFPVLLVASLSLSGTSVTVPLARGARNDQTLTEAAVLPAVVLLHPGWAILVAVLGEVFSEAIVLRKHPLKVSFNVGWTAVGTALAAAAFAGLWDGELTSLVTIVAALAAALAYTSVNLLALYHVSSAVTDRPIIEVARGGLAEDTQHSIANASVGILGAILLIEAAWVLPLLAVPLLLARSRASVRRRHEHELLDERNRFDRTIAGASDGIVLVDREGTIQVWNAAAEGVTGRRAETTVGRSITDHLPLLDLQGEDIDIALRLQECRHAYGPESWNAVVPGTGRIISVSVSTDASGHELVLILHDITRQQELERMREDLVSRVSHELRTPLATTTGFLETVLGRWEQLTDEQRRELMRMAHRSSRRLTRVVAGLLVRSRIEGAAAAPRPDVVDLANAIDGILEELGDTVSRLVEVTHVPDDDPQAYVDPDHLQQIIENLVVNAERYGAGRTEIALLGLPGTIAIEVRDHGNGVDPDFVPHLFDAFTQASIGLRRTAEGLGLGLSIVRALAEANGGQVSYDDAPGGGAQFTVRLPRPVAPQRDLIVNRVGRS